MEIIQQQQQQQTSKDRIKWKRKYTQADNNRRPFNQKKEINKIKEEWRTIESTGTRGLKWQ